MHRLLVVEDEEITADLLRRYFEIVGYEVASALNGADAIRMARERKPDVIILDIMLPDMDGYEICKRLRAEERTEKIPVLFLTQKDDRRDRLDGLGLGADDYITKPFDIEELRLRVHNIIARLGGTPLVDARTSLPSVELIKERLPRLLEDPEIMYVDVQVEHLDAFGRQYGPVARNQVVRTAAKVIGDTLHELDPANSFIGHPRDDHFLVAFKRDHYRRLKEELPRRFEALIPNFYDYRDRERGRMHVGDDLLLPFMRFKLVRVHADALRPMVRSASPPPASTT